MSSYPVYRVLSRNPKQRTAEGVVLADSLTQEAASALARALRQMQGTDPYDPETFSVYWVEPMPLEEQAAILTEEEAAAEVAAAAEEFADALGRLAATFAARRAPVVAMQERPPQPWEPEYDPAIAPAGAPAWVRGNFFPAQRLAVRMTELGYDDEDAYDLCSRLAGRRITSRKNLTGDEILRVHLFLNANASRARSAAA